MKAHLVGIATIVAWSGGLSFVMFAAIRNMGLLRVEEHEEAQGIDVAEFSPSRAYTHAIVPQPVDLDAFEVKSQDRSPMANRPPPPFSTQKPVEVTVDTANGHGSANGHKVVEELVVQPVDAVETLSPEMSDAEEVA
jgi:hypothetical protein